MGFLEEGATIAACAVLTTREGQTRVQFLCQTFTEWHEKESNTEQHAWVSVTSSSGRVFLAEQQR